MTNTNYYEAIISNGGLTFSPMRPTPVSGYMVSVAGSERTFPLHSFSVSDLNKYMHEYLDRVVYESMFFGAWIDGDLVYLDLSVNIADRNAAVVLGRMESQLAIYDVTNEKVISL
ncbi:hypothetical protein [Streptomyces sp. NPDC018045]|uniref:hypothetical protein n=1 Tax=Streptomyces sp. NPDC018045 TaxID=3365037 RepID=UPI0037958FC1